MTKKLMIFDVDGVLLNSEGLYRSMHREWFKELGVHLSVEKHQSFVGSSATGFWQYLVRENALAGKVETYIELEKELKYKALFESDLAATEHIRELLEFLKNNGNSIAIASSGLRKNIDLILQRLGFEKYFDLIVSGEQVTKGKPHPDIFLKAADHYDRRPDNCIVIEDSANGVCAAKAAGMFCIGYRNPDSGNQDLSGADLVIETFKDQRLYHVI